MDHSISEILNDRGSFDTYLQKFLMSGSHDGETLGKYILKGKNNTDSSDTGGPIFLDKYHY